VTILVRKKQRRSTSEGLSLSSKHGAVQNALMLLTEDLDSDVVEPFD